MFKKLIVATIQSKMARDVEFRRLMSLTEVGATATSLGNRSYPENFAVATPDAPDGSTYMRKKGQNFTVDLTYGPDAVPQTDCPIRCSLDSLFPDWQLRHLWSLRCALILRLV